jgi:CheY-like chemotaxis protein
MKQVLVIEDDKNISDLVQIHLKDLGCAVTNASDGETGLNKALNGSYDPIYSFSGYPSICRQPDPLFQLMHECKMCARQQEKWN